MHELIKGGSLMCTGGSQKRIDGPHSVKYSFCQIKRDVHTDTFMRRNPLSFCAGIRAMNFSFLDILSAAYQLKIVHLERAGRFKVGTENGKI